MSKSFIPTIQSVNLTTREEVTIKTEYSSTEGGTLRIEVPKINKIEYLRQTVTTVSKILPADFRGENKLTVRGLQVSYKLYKGASAIIRFGIKKNEWFEIYLIQNLTNSKREISFEQYCNEQRDNEDVREIASPIDILFDIPGIINGVDFLQPKQKITFQFALEFPIASEDPSFFEIKNLAKLKFKNGGGDPVSATTNPPSGPQRGG